MNVKAILADPLEFCGRLKIIDKKGKSVSFRPNSEQMQIIEALAGGDDTLVLKPRQIGSTTAAAAFFFWRIYTSHDSLTHVILSHKSASSKHIFQMFLRFYDGLPRPLQRKLSVRTSSELRFADTGAGVSALSSGGDGGLRSFTASSIHISEFAFTADADELKSTAIAALNGGQLLIESTANFFGDPLHREIGLWDAGIVDWNFLFFKWTDHAEYSTPPGPDFEPDPDSTLTPGQQCWGGKMSGQLGETKFRREYPLSVDDAYSQNDGAWMGAETLRDLEILQLEPAGGQIERVQAAAKYTIGVDAGAGTGGDPSVLVVVHCSSGQVVEIRRSRTEAPVEWAETVAAASAKWNGAKVLVESNGTWGGIIVNELQHARVPQWTDAAGKYWTTNAHNKPMMLDYLKDSILRGRILQLDSHTVGELRSFILNDRGVPECPRSPLHHGDSVIALALALQCALSVKVDVTPFIPQWIKDRKAAHHRREGGKVEHRRY
jgi:hypothetical protein